MCSYVCFILLALVVTFFPSKITRKSIRLAERPVCENFVKEALCPALVDREG